MKNLRPLFLLSLATTCLGVGLATGGNQAKKKPIKAIRKVDYNRDVRPILSEHCYKCHGPDGKEVKGDLRLSDAKDATRDRDGDFAIKPGKSKESIIMERIKIGAGSPMPPKDSGMPALTADQIETLKLWIDQGAQYDKHWAFVVPTMPAIPTVSSKAIIRNPIDNFIVQKLGSKNLKQEVEASPATLLRRASLSLTGLLPTPEEIRQLETDKKPGAYERAIDRLLASERYGEHQARYWLDAVRYGDTHGLHVDSERGIYPYRDWVVRAFNQDMPFDTFTKWQMAGDLMPNPTTDMKIATGYVRMNPTTNEGGAIEEEVLVRNTFDRVDTMSTVFLGMTVGCAKCHDHKFDPIPTKSYYQLYAFFNSTKDSPLDGNLLNPEPTILAPTLEEEKVIEANMAKMTKIESDTSIEDAQKWISANRVPPMKIGDWEVSNPFIHKNFDEAFDTDEKPTQWKPITIVPGKDTPVIGKDNASGYLRSKITSQSDGELVLRLSSDDGIKVWVNDKLVHSNKVARGVATGVDVVKITVKKGENPIVIKIVNIGGPDGIIFNSGSDRALKIEEAFSKKDPALTRKTFLSEGPTTTASAQYRALASEVVKVTASIPRTMIAEELPMPRQAYILNRGEYDLRTDKVERGVPSAFGELPPEAPRNRLGLAQWLTDKKNPLTNRVFVNRIWQQHFGTGIVKTAEDFGNQGEWPSHPELLDYLAIKFAKDGFSIKKLHKLILTSATFRQQSVISTKKELIDPENRLFSRGPRFRLDAEVLRDQVLQASGLLVNRHGGRGFKPYQPAGLWEEITIDISSTAKYVQDKTSEIYRRSLYLFWKRTSPHPAMMSFDAPSREACVVRRARTNTPLQALITMNEPAFMESSRVFGERLVKTKKSPTDRIKFAFSIALGREPSKVEQAILLNAAKRYNDKFTQNPKDANEIVMSGMAPLAPGLTKSEVATWTMIASTIFNLDEFLTQH
jgi:mono/diheme cytochrome c family protein